MPGDEAPYRCRSFQLNSQGYIDQHQTKSTPKIFFTKIQYLVPELKRFVRSRVHKSTQRPTNLAPQSTVLDERMSAISIEKLKALCDRSTPTTTATVLNLAAYLRFVQRNWNAYFK